MLLIPPPLYGAVTLLAMWLLKKYYPLQCTGTTWPVKAGIAIVISGLLIELFAVLSFRRAQTTINPLRPDNTTALVTDGIYALSRNPMYLGMAFILTGAALTGTDIDFYPDAAGTATAPASQRSFRYELQP